MLRGPPPARAVRHAWLCCQAAWRPPPPLHHPGCRSSSTAGVQLPSDRFSELPVSELTRRAIANVMRYEKLTKVQQETLPVILAGHDVVAKAKTGTGKTIGFLLPTIERLVAAKADRKRGVLALAISPTRELALQIRNECELLITFHKPSLTSRAVIGGTNLNVDIKALTDANPPTILVATPGRLIELLADPRVLPKFSDLQALILDEADKLLDMGFRPDIKTILAALEPSRATRQTLLFSATLTSDVFQVARFATPSEPKLVDTVGADEQTHAQVEQSATVSPNTALSAELLGLVRELSARPGYKIVAFFTTARLTQLYVQLFAAIGTPVLEMHSRKTMSHRTKVAAEFRQGSDLIMFTSDVSARGMDYPDVTAVVQVGLPSDKSQYIHRLGRTGRAGKRGGGYLLLADFESGFLQQLSDLPLKQRPGIPEAQRGPLNGEIRAAFDLLPSDTLEATYRAYLGFYNTNLSKIGVAREECVARANEFALEVMGLRSPPPVEARIIRKLHLNRVPGLVRGPREGGKKGGDQQGGDRPGGGHDHGGPDG